MIAEIKNLEVGKPITLIYGRLDSITDSDLVCNTLYNELYNHQFKSRFFDFFYYPRSHDLPENQFKFVEDVYTNFKDSIDGGNSIVVVTNSPIIFETFISYMQRFGYFESSKIYKVNKPITNLSVDYVELPNLEIMEKEVWLPLHKVIQKLENIEWGYDYE